MHRTIASLLFFIQVGDIIQQLGILPSVVELRMTYSIQPLPNFGSQQQPLQQQHTTAQQQQQQPLQQPLQQQHTTAQEQQQQQQQQQQEPQPVLMQSTHHPQLQPPMQALPYQTHCQPVPHELPAVPGIDVARAGADGDITDGFDRGYKNRSFACVEFHDPGHASDLAGLEGGHTQLFEAAAQAAFQAMMGGEGGGAGMAGDARAPAAAFPLSQAPPAVSQERSPLPIPDAATDQRVGNVRLGQVHKPGMSAAHAGRTPVPTLDLTAPLIASLEQHPALNQDTLTPAPNHVASPTSPQRCPTLNKDALTPAPDHAAPRTSPKQHPALSTDLTPGAANNGQETNPSAVGALVVTRAAASQPNGTEADPWAKQQLLSISDQGADRGLSPPYRAAIAQKQVGRSRCRCCCKQLVQECQVTVVHACMCSVCVCVCARACLCPVCLQYVIVKMVHSANPPGHVYTRSYTFPGIL